MIVLTSSFLLAACNNDKSSATSTTTDSTAMVDNTAVNTTDNTTTNMATSGNIKDIMDKSMQEMKTMKSSGNPDNDFASMMKMHHMSAIEASQVELSQGMDAEIKTMAQKMLDDQQKEVAEFNTFLSGHNAHGGGDGFHKEAMSMMNNMKMSMDNAGSIDRQFVTMMIPHHQSAIDMSKAYIKAGAHEPKMKTMANNIISSQQKEIQDLRSWLNKNK